MCVPHHSIAFVCQGLAPRYPGVPSVHWAVCWTSCNIGRAISLAPDHSLSFSLPRTLSQLCLWQALSNKTSVWKVSGKTSSSSCEVLPSRFLSLLSFPLHMHPIPIPGFACFPLVIGSVILEHRLTEPRQRISKGSFKCSIKEGMQGEKQAPTRMASFSFLWGSPVFTACVWPPSSSNQALSFFSLPPPPHPPHSLISL